MIVTLNMISDIANLHYALWAWSDLIASRKSYIQPDFRLDAIRTKHSEIVNDYIEFLKAKYETIKK